MRLFSIFDRFRICYMMDSVSTVIGGNMGCHLKGWGGNTNDYGLALYFPGKLSSSEPTLACRW